MSSSDGSSTARGPESPCDTLSTMPTLTPSQAHTGKSGDASVNGVTTASPVKHTPEISETNAENAGNEDVPMTDVSPMPEPSITASPARQESPTREEHAGASFEIIHHRDGVSPGPSNGDTPAKKLLYKPQMYATTLTTNDAEACVLLENEAFPENLRATREKILYRLRENSGLCLGIKATVFPNHHSSTPYRTMATFPVAVKFADTTTRRPSKFQPRSSILLGHVICTLSESKVINDAGMALPPDWETATSYQTKYPELGNKPLGRTLCIHSLAVLEGVRDFGVASLLLNELAKRMKTHDVVDRIALICEGKLVKFYQSRGFKKVGESDVKFGGVPWFDMVLTIKTPPKVTTKRKLQSV